MKATLVASLLAVSALIANARSSSDYWADKAKGDEDRMERQMQAIELSGECFHYRLLMSDSPEEKIEEGKPIGEAVIAMARDVYGKIYDAMVQDPEMQGMKDMSRDFFIGMMFGTAQSKGEAEGTRRFAAQTKDANYTKNGMNLVARRLYRERHCNLPPR